MKAIMAIIMAKTIGKVNIIFINFLIIQYTHIMVIVIFFNDKSY